MSDNNSCPICDKPASPDSYDPKLCLKCDRACIEDAIQEHLSDRKVLFERAEIAEKACVILYEKLLESENKHQELVNLINELGIKNVTCTCGSGGHPRKCEKHPWRFEIHCLEIDYENAKLDLDELNELRELKELSLKGK